MCEKAAYQVRFPCASITTLHVRFCRGAHAIMLPRAGACALHPVRECHHYCRGADLHCCALTFAPRSHCVFYFYNVLTHYLRNKTTKTYLARISVLQRTVNKSSGIAKTLTSGTKSSLIPTCLY